MFNAERNADHGPLIFGCLMVVVGAVLLFDVRGTARHMTQRVVDGSPFHARFGGVTFNYRLARLPGLVGVLVGVVVALLF